MSDNLDASGGARQSRRSRRARQEPPKSVLQAYHELFVMVRYQDRLSQVWTRFLLTIQSGLALALFAVLALGPTWDWRMWISLIIPVIGCTTAVALTYASILERNWQGRYVARLKDLQREHGLPVVFADAEGPPPSTTAPAQEENHKSKGRGIRRVTRVLAWLTIPLRTGDARRTDKRRLDDDTFWSVAVKGHGIGRVSRALRWLMILLVLGWIAVAGLLAIVTIRAENLPPRTTWVLR